MTESWRPERTRGESLDREIRSMVPGSWGGRIAQAMPVRDRRYNTVESLDAEQIASVTSDIAFEANDSATVTAGDVAAGYMTLELSYIPLEESLRVVFSRMVLPPVKYSMVGSTTLRVPLSSWVTAGDRLWVHYAYLRPYVSDAVPLVPPVVRGARSYRQGWVSVAPTAVLAMPVGTVVGDLVVMVVASSTGFGSPGGGHTFTDSRFTKVHDFPYPGGSSAYIGTATHLGDVTVTFGHVGTGSTNNWAGIAMMSWTGPQAGAQVAAESNGSTVITQVPVGGGANGALALITGTSGIGGIDISSVTGSGYSMIVRDGSSYVVACIALTSTANGGSATVAYSITDPRNGACAVVALK